MRYNQECDCRRYTIKGAIEPVYNQGCEIKDAYCVDGVGVWRVNFEVEADGVKKRPQAKTSKRAY